MNSALWIAVAAAALVVLAHAALFWWFLCKPRKDDPGRGPSDDAAPPDGE